MSRLPHAVVLLIVLAVTLAFTVTLAANAQEGRPPGTPPQGGPPQGGPPQAGPPRTGNGPGSDEELMLVEAHDLDGDGWLNRAERAEARKAVVAQREARAQEAQGGGPGPEGGRGPEGRRGPDGRRGSGGRRGSRERAREPAQPGPRVSPSDVESFPDAPLYDQSTLRTIFLNFENEDWEAELQDFRHTDVEVPARMIVDGTTYDGVGASFRGASSYFRVPAGYKRSLNLSVDLVDDDQRLDGYKTLNLLNCNGDPSMLSTVLYSRMADPYLAVPKANFVKVVINGEYWGVYVNVQQFDNVFTRENFGSSKGTRWKVPGSPRGDGGLAYDGDDLEPYRERYDMKSNDGRKAWLALVELCRVLNETPLENLVEELSPHLDIDEALWFLAFDVALINSDGYWTRASDYSLFCDANGQFHVIPHDMNESFRPARARRGAGAGGSPGMKLDPLVGLDNDRMPLRSRLLAVPELRERYLDHVRTIAESPLDWETLGPQITAYRTLIDDAVRQDTRKLDSYDAFLEATSTTSSEEQAYGPDGSLQSFARQRRAYLLGEPESQEAE